MALQLVQEENVPIQDPPETNNICKFCYYRGAQSLHFGCSHELSANQVPTIKLEHCFQSCPCFDDKHAEFMKTLSFTHFYFSKLHDTELVRSMAIQKDGVFEVNIREVLEQVLSIETRCKLEHLSLNGDNMKFHEDWVYDVFRMFPMLTSLTVTSYNFSSTDLKCIGTSFYDLRKLDISDSTLSNLDGLERLDTLTEFRYRNSKFERSEDIEQLSKLKDLITLDVSASSGNTSSFAQLYTECEHAHHKLRYFRCANNTFSAGTLEKIVSKNYSLKEIGLLDANVSGLVSLRQRYPKVQFLTTENIPQCIRSFNALKSYSRRMSGGVYNKMLEILEERKVHNADENKELLDFTLNAISDDQENEYFAPQLIKGLYFLTCNINPEAFTPSTIQSVVRVCLSSIKQRNVLEEAHKYAWMALKPGFIAGSPTEVIDDICLQAADWAGRPEPNWNKNQYVDILSHFLLIISSDSRRSITENGLLRRGLADHLMIHNYDNHPNELLKLLNLLSNFCTNSETVLNFELVKISIHCLVNKLTQLNFNRWNNGQLGLGFDSTFTIEETFLDKLNFILMNIKEPLFLENLWDREICIRDIMLMLDRVWEPYKINSGPIASKAVEFLLRCVNIAKFDDIEMDETKFATFMKDLVWFVNAFKENGQKREYFMLYENSHQDLYGTVHNRLSSKGVNLDVRDWYFVARNFIFQWREKNRQPYF